MILGGKTVQLERGSLMGERAMTITANAKAFNILLDKLYSNKEGAVVREICTNAFDAMVDAGKAGQPFRITVPDAMDHNFIVSDDGIGLSEEQVHDLIGGVFNSSKDNSNKTAGAFGLGSKCPFALTDSFSIESRHEGKKLHFLAFKNEEGVPAVLKTGEEPTEECNGVTISIPIPQESYRKFEKEIHNQLRFFDPKPIVTNRTDFTWEDSELVVEGDGYSLFKGESQWCEVWVKMGPVGYPVSLNSLPLSQQRTLGNIRGRGVVINANIGDVDIPPSREALEYTPRTVRFLETRIDSVMSVVVRKLLSTVIEATDLRKKADAALEINRSMDSASLRRFIDSLGAEGLTEEDLDYIEAAKLALSPQSIRNRTLKTYSVFKPAEENAEPLEVSLKLEDDAGATEAVVDTKTATGTEIFMYRVVDRFPCTGWHGHLPTEPEGIAARDFRKLHHLTLNGMDAFLHVSLHVIMDVEDRILQRLLGVSKEAAQNGLSARNIWLWKHTSEFARHAGKQHVEAPEIEDIVKSCGEFDHRFNGHAFQVRMLSSFEPVKVGALKPKPQVTVPGVMRYRATRKTNIKWGDLMPLMGVKGTRTIMLRTYAQDIVPEHRKWGNVADLMSNVEGFEVLFVGATASKKTIQELLNMGAVWIDDWAREMNRKGIPKEHQDCVFSLAEVRRRARVMISILGVGGDLWILKRVAARNAMDYSVAAKLREIYSSQHLYTTRQAVKRGADAAMRLRGCRGDDLEHLFTLTESMDIYGLARPEVQEALKALAQKLKTVPSEKEHEND